MKIRWAAGGGRWAVLLLCVLLAACGSAPKKTEGGGKYYLDDGPPGSVPDNMGSVPDAVPRDEPFHKFANRPYTVMGRTYVPIVNKERTVQRGIASWYGKKFHGQRTSSGEIYDMFAMTAAHKTLPIPCYAEITNLRNGRKVVVRINDRGPFVGDRIVDLSYTAAAKLDMLMAGTAPVELRVLTPGGSAAGSALPPVMPASPPPPVFPTAPSMPPPAAPTVTVVNAPAARIPGVTPMFIQAGMFADHENARRRVEQLLAAGIELASLDEMPRNDRTLHRVRVGPFASTEEFDLNMKRLHDLGISDAHLITE